MEHVNHRIRIPSRQDQQDVCGRVIELSKREGDAT